MLKEKAKNTHHHHHFNMSASLGDELGEVKTLQKLPPKANYELSPMRPRTADVAISATDQAIQVEQRQQQQQQQHHHHQQQHKVKEQIASGHSLPPADSSGGSSEATNNQSIPPVGSGTTSKPNDMIPNLLRNRVGFW